MSLGLRRFDFPVFDAVVVNVLHAVEILLQDEEAVPMRPIRCAHQGTLTRAASFVMPEVIVENLEFVFPGVVFQQPFFARSSSISFAGS